MELKYPPRVSRGLLTRCYFSKYNILHSPVQDTRSLFFICVAAYDHISKVEDFALLIRAVDNSSNTISRKDIQPFPSTEIMWQ